MYRALRVKQTGQWCGPLLIDSDFPADAEDYADRVAVTLGLAAGALEVVDSANDPRTPPLLEDPNASPEPAHQPDVNGFLLAGMGALGLARANELMAQWPTFTRALDAANFALARQILGAAAQAQSVTPEEYASFEALMLEHHIP